MLEVIDKGSITESHPVPLLFVHGAFHAAWCWDENFLDFFADKGFRAAAVSLRGHGASTLSQRLSSCCIADYVDDVRAVANKLGSAPVVIGHSMGCLVVQAYLAKQGAPAAVLMAPATPKGVRRSVMRMFRRHPWVFLRSITFGKSADMVNTPALAREFLFCGDTPELIVKFFAARMEPESARAGLDQMFVRPPKAELVTAPVLVLGAKEDGSRIGDGDVSATARAYRTKGEFFPDMGHNMMLEPGWKAVAERIVGWLTARGAMRATSVRADQRATQRAGAGARPAAHPPRPSTAAAHPAPKPHGEEPPPSATRSRWCRCRTRAEPRFARSGQHFTLKATTSRSEGGESTTLPDTPAQTPFEHLGAYGRWHRTMRAREERRAAR
jgi:pimeloyl-ACP methyl ester carboxylesterase